MAPRSIYDSRSMTPTDKLEPRIRIIIADDHLLLRQGLQVLIDTEPDMAVVAQADSGKSVVRRRVSYGRERSGAPVPSPPAGSAQGVPERRCSYTTRTSCSPGVRMSFEGGR